MPSIVSILRVEMQRHDLGLLDLSLHANALRGAGPAPARSQPTRRLWSSFASTSVFAKATSSLAWSRRGMSWSTSIICGKIGTTAMRPSIVK